MRVIDCSGEPAYEATTIPHATMAVEILRLHVDPVAKSSTSLVRFPAGWERPVDGNYSVDEEILVLDGELIVTGVSYTPGVYGWIARGGLRRLSATPTGCVALAWFSGIPTWSSTADDLATTPSVRIDLNNARPGSSPSPFGAMGRRIRESTAGSCWSVSGPPHHRASSDTEVFDLKDRRWCRVDAGETPPLWPGRLLVRSFN